MAYEEGAAMHRYRSDSQVVNLLHASPSENFVYVPAKLSVGFRKKINFDLCNLAHIAF